MTGRPACSGLELYQERCRTAARRHNTAATMIYGAGPRSTPHQAREMRRHGVLALAAMYGCARVSVCHLVCPVTAQPIMASIDAHDGSVVLVSIVTHKRHPEHHLHEGWREPATLDLHGDDLSRINRELRGVSRALWLLCLWRGEDVGLIRRRWYHWTSVAPYWSAAWQCLRDDGAVLDLLMYAQSLSMLYTELHPKGRTHAAQAYITAAADLLGYGDGHAETQSQEMSA
jgi:hypothetical protein